MDCCKFAFCDVPVVCSFLDAVVDTDSQSLSRIFVLFSRLSLSILSLNVLPSVFLLNVATESRSRAPLHSSHVPGANNLSRRIYPKSSAPYHTGRFQYVVIYFFNFLQCHIKNVSPKRFGNKKEKKCYY